jgi:hypothetical protein
MVGLVGRTRSATAHTDKEQGADEYGEDNTPRGGNGRCPAHRRWSFL